jgi:hypothetical protein
MVRTARAYSSPPTALLLIAGLPIKPHRKCLPSALGASCILPWLPSFVPSPIAFNLTLFSSPPSPSPLTSVVSRRFIAFLFRGSGLQSLCGNSYLRDGAA